MQFKNQIILRLQLQHIVIMKYYDLHSWFHGKTLYKLKTEYAPVSSLDKFIVNRPITAGIQRLIQVLHPEDCNIFRSK